MDGSGERHYGIGDRAPRKEDRRLLTGRGRYADDVRIEGALAGYVLRAPEAHGDIRALDTGAAAAMPGVRLILRAQDLIEFGCRPFPCRLPIKGRGGAAILTPVRHALAHGRVRFIGEPVAFVVADTLERARDAAESIAPRNRTASGPARSVAGDSGRCTDDARQRPRQCRARLGRRRRSGDGQGLRRRRPCHPPAHRQPARRADLDRAAQRHWRLGLRERPLHDSHRRAGRLRPVAQPGGTGRRQGRRRPGADGRCRRLLRHERRRLSGACAVPGRRAADRPAGAAGATTAPKASSATPPAGISMSTANWRWMRMAGFSPCAWSASPTWAPTSPASARCPAPGIS